MARPAGVRPGTAARQAQRPRTLRLRTNRSPAHRFKTRPAPDARPTIRPPHAVVLRTRPPPGPALPGAPIRTRQPRAGEALVAPPLAGPLEALARRSQKPPRRGRRHQATAVAPARTPLPASPRPTHLARAEPNRPRAEPNRHGPVTRRHRRPRRSPRRSGRTTPPGRELRTT